MVHLVCKPVGLACSTREVLELEALPTGGDGAWRGVPLARLLWQLPPARLAAFLEALLLERRVLVVSRDPGTVSTAVVAAAAALHPFAWQHIFVPLMPIGMKARTAHTSSHAAQVMLLNNATYPTLP